MSREEYTKARKLGEKAYQACQHRGEFPYLPMLEDVTAEVSIKSRISLGIVNIPLDNVVGTNSKGRTTAFASNFMPLFAADTEFGIKWSNLYDSMLEHGLREPIVAIEYMNRYYVVEGNKRVSVLKYMDAVSVEASVTRYVPQRTEERENKIYYEYLAFYRDTAINYIWFTQEGSFHKLIRLVGKHPGEAWGDEDKHTFHASYYRFASEFRQKGGEKLDITIGDAFLLYLEIFGYAEMKEKSIQVLRRELSSIWEEYVVKSNGDSMAFLLEPTETKADFITKLLSTQPQLLKIAFIHHKNAKISGWTLSHEIGREYVNRVFGSRIETTCREDVTLDTIEDTMKELIDNGFKVIFVTSPIFLGANLKAAVARPDLKIINCSLLPTYKHIRTYYLRMYEAKFLTGLIAGALTENDKVGYVADYPICGITAGINAFAIGAKMVNPRVKVYLEWSTLKDKNMDYVREAMKRHDVHVISNRDINAPIHASREFGLYCTRENDEPVNIAMPDCHWGKLYEFLIKKILNGKWDSESAVSEDQALNYWWGMSADAIDVVYSDKIPSDTRRLVNLFHKEIQAGVFHPFAGELRSQEGIVQDDPNAILPPAEIITMDWLADNVIGRIPDIEDLREDARAVAKIQGIKNRVLTDGVIESASFPDLDI